jgi:hypothetical protein
VLDSQQCGLYYMRTASDQFGCSLRENEYALPDYVQSIIENRGTVDAEVRDPDFTTCFNVLNVFRQH